MGVFKAVGYPEDVGRFYRLEEYAGYCWTAHGRYPTNTPGWWGGAHPFALLRLLGRAQRRDLLLRRQPPLHRDVRLPMHAADRYRGHHVHCRLSAPAAGPDAGGNGQRHRRAVLEHDRGKSRAARRERLTYLRNGVFQPACYGAVLHPARLQRRADGAERPAEARARWSRRKRTIGVFIASEEAAIRVVEPDAAQHLGADGRRAGHRRA